MHQISNHLQRVLTGIVLSVLIIPAIWFLPSFALALLFLIIAVLFAIEWGALVQTNDILKWIYPVITIAISGALWWQPQIYPSLLIVTAIWWGMMLVVSTFFNSDQCKKLTFRMLLRIHLPMTLPICWFTLCTTDKVWLLYMIVLVIACDVGAYYAGKRFGKALLCPNISKGKTRAGLVGAIVASVVVTLTTNAIVSALQHSDLSISHYFSLIDFILVGICLCFISIVGDITASMAKRCANVKDSGHLLPGHGGVVDRLDSLVAVVPFFALAGYYL